MPLEFIEPMQCLLVADLPEGVQWTYEIKWDGYRALGIVENGKARLISRNAKSFASDFPQLRADLAHLKCKSAIVDGEVVAFDEHGKPSFQQLQQKKNRTAELRLVLFDALHVNGKDLTALPLSKRRQALKKLLPQPVGSLMSSPPLEGTTEQLLNAAEENGLEGIVGKRLDSPYEPGERSGAWVKRKTERKETFIIGGYIPNAGSFDELLIGIKDGRQLLYVASVRAGFVPRVRAEVMDRIKPLVTGKCPFHNLPEVGKARWGRSMDAEKMKDCIWVKPSCMALVAFVEWTDARHLRHARFVSLAAK